jgi:hypothetical protein
MLEDDIQDDIQQQRLKLKKNQTKLERDELLQQFEMGVVRGNHANCYLESPNAEDDRECDEGNEVDQDFVGCGRALSRHNVENQEDDHMNDCHLQYQEAENSELLSESR